MKMNHRAGIEPDPIPDSRATDAADRDAIVLQLLDELTAQARNGKTPDFASIGKRYPDLGDRHGGRRFRERVADPRLSRACQCWCQLSAYVRAAAACRRLRNLGGDRPRGHGSRLPRAAGEP